MDEHSKDFFNFFQSSFLNALLWISLWGIVYLGIDLLASGNELTEFVIYLCMLVLIVLIKIFYPESIRSP
jgi:hypothetical protein